MYLNSDDGLEALYMQMDLLWFSAEQRKRHLDVNHVRLRVYKRTVRKHNTTHARALINRYHSGETNVFATLYEMLHYGGWAAWKQIFSRANCHVT